MHKLRPDGRQEGGVDLVVSPVRRAQDPHSRTLKVGWERSLLVSTRCMIDLLHSDGVWMGSSLGYLLETCLHSLSSALIIRRLDIPSVRSR